MAENDFEALSYALGQTDELFDLFEQVLKNDFSGSYQKKDFSAVAEKLKSKADIVVPSVQQKKEEPAEETLDERCNMTLSRLSECARNCSLCRLCETRKSVVFGEGCTNRPDVMVIGEGPGEMEDNTGRPFVGPAGQFLDKWLAPISLSRDKNVYITNIVKCRPPQNRDPLPDEEAACYFFLEAQIHILKPKMILCMGRVAGQKLLDTQAPLHELRSTPHEYNHIPVMVTYHPSALLRDEALKRPAWEDLKKFRGELDKILAQSSN